MKNHKITIWSIFTVCLLLIFLIFFTHNKKYPMNNLPMSDKIVVTDNSSAIIENNYVIDIPRLNITAPIIIDVDGNDQKAYDKALENGVAHLQKTALPGRSGNVVIFGHSNFYKWKPGNYKTIFSKLDYLEPGDQIIIISNLKAHTYEVYDKRVVSPKQIDVVDQNLDEKKLTLITCWPIGSDEERLVVVATLVTKLPVSY